MNLTDTAIVSDIIRVGVNAAGSHVMQMRTRGALRVFTCSEVVETTSTPAPTPAPLPTPSPAPEVKPIVINDLAKAKFESGKRYRLSTAATHRLASTLELPAGLHDVEIDATGATIETTAKPGLRIDGKNITIIAGTWSSASKVAVFFLDGVDCALVAPIFAGGGGLVSTRGATRPTITGPRVTGTYDDNLIYCGSGTSSGLNGTNVRIDDLVDTFGSTGENGIRVHGTDGFHFTNIHLIGSYRGSCMRIHDGSAGLLEDFVFSQAWGGGPLADGDGAEKDGWNVFDGVWRAITKDEKDYKGRTFAEAFARRAEKLALRFIGLTARRGKWRNQLGLNAGLIDLLIEDCEQENPRNQPLDIGWSYPSARFRIKGETLRPAPMGVLRRLTIIDDNGDLGGIPPGLTLDACTVNGRPVVGGKVAA